MRAVQSLDRHTAAFGRCEPNPEPIDWHAEEPSQRQRDPSLLSINFNSSIIRSPDEPWHLRLCKVKMYTLALCVARLSTFVARRFASERRAAGSSTTRRC